MRDIEEIKQDLSYDASWWQPADLHSIACDLLAEVERLRAEATTTLVGCACCERGVPPRYAVLGMCPTCAAEELTRLRSLLAPIIVPCERCGRKVRGNIERVCQVCAAEELTRLREAGDDARY